VLGYVYRFKFVTMMMRVMTLKVMTAMTVKVSTVLSV
jgi:hypothetical protein